MATNVYEGMFIFDSGRYGRDPENVSGAVARIVEAAGGEVLVSRLWEERRLAYPIKGQKKGTYWLTYFRVEGGKLAGITRQSELDDNVLRCLLLKVDPRIVDTLVAHATSGIASWSAERSGEAEGAEAATAATAVLEVEDEVGVETELDEED